MMVCADARIDRIAGGYLRVDSATILRAWEACHGSTKLGTGGFRVWLATIEVRHRRLRTASKPEELVIDPDEVAKLCGITRRRATALLGRLDQVAAKATDQLTTDLSLILSRGGQVALPRRLVRWLLRSQASRSVIAVALAAVLRCVSFRAGSFNGVGRLASSWVANVFAVSVRSVKAARKTLEDVGVIARQATQRDWWIATRRHGGVVFVDLSWQPPGHRERSRSALNGRSKSAGSAPISNPSLPGTGMKEKPDPSEGTGFQVQGTGKEETQTLRRGGSLPDAPSAVPVVAPLTPDPQTATQGGEPVGLTTPRLDDVHASDLRDAGRMIELHRQAAERGLCGTSEADQLRVLTIAEHAAKIGKRNPAGLFVGLLKGKLWHFATQDDEDAARKRLRAHLWPARAAVSPVPMRPVAMAPILSEDARIAWEISRSLAAAGYRGDPFPHMRRLDPSWTRARWDEALR